jgi:putative ABC transport system permease protein
MWLFVRLAFESFGFAWEALRSNWLRTLLSLLGVTVGIFAIIAVFSIVDSLEKSIRQSLAFLGDRVIYVQKMPWTFGPDYPWWKYFGRPAASYDEYKYLEKYLESSSAIAIFATKGNSVVKYKNNSLQRATVLGTTYGYAGVSEVKIAQGRYFSLQEMERARKVVIIGHDIAKELYPDTEPVGKEIVIKNTKFNVIGVLEREGENFLGGPSADMQCIIPYGVFSKMYRVGRMGIEPTISLKGFDRDENLLALENEVRGLMRAKRSLKPREEENFALNRPEMIAQQVSSIFGVLNVAGIFIGGFAILVGAFGIANIMFVSVKERTHIIGIQKSLGAKNYVILFQFLFEAIFLSLLGGLAGLFLVFLITLIPQDSLALELSLGNVLTGLSISTVVGILSGVIPAFIAARLDPVEAIRTQ